MSKGSIKSSLEEAAIELETIFETATKNAKDKMATDMSEKFEEILNEEIKKNKESVKESDKDNKKEPTNEGNKKTDVNKESLNETEEIDIRDMSMDEVEAAFNEANGEDEFEVEDDTELSIDDIAQELDGMKNMSTDMEQNVQAEATQENQPFDKIRKIHEMMSEMIKQFEDQQVHEEMQESFNTKMKEMYGENYATDLGENYDSLFEMFVAKSKGDPYKKSSVNESDDEDNKNKNDKNMEDNSEIVENEIVENVDNDVDDDKNVRDDEEKVDEIHGQSFSTGKVSAGRLPNQGAEYRDARNRPEWSSKNEGWEKKMKSLIEENKKLTKKLQESSTKTNDNSEVVDKLIKFRNQLQEMAVANANIANVNRILVNESNLTLEQKQDVINKFKNIKSTTESDNIYKNLIKEMAETNKKTLSEGIEEKITDTLGESSSQKVVEQVVEKTGFAKNVHLNTILERMNYVSKK